MKFGKGFDSQFWLWTVQNFMCQENVIYVGVYFCFFHFLSVPNKQIRNKNFGQMTICFPGGIERGPERLEDARERWQDAILNLRFQNQSSNCHPTKMLALTADSSSDQSWESLGLLRVLQLNIGLLRDHMLGS